MSDVVLTIGGRAYTIACAVGEEAHIADLGRIIDAKLSTLPGAAGKNAGKNDSRSLLFAALLLADELHELRSTAARASTATTAPALQETVPPGQLDALAARLEALADALEVTA